MAGEMVLGWKKSLPLMDGYCHRSFRQIRPGAVA
jgi:hypothetical protein